MRSTWPASAATPWPWGFPTRGTRPSSEDPEALLRAFPKAPCLRLRFTVGEGVRLSEARPYAPLPLSLYREGVRVRLTGYRVHPDLARYKTGNYLPYRLALEEARKEGPLRASSWTPSATWWTGAARAPSSSGRGRSTSWRGPGGITREKVAEAARGLGLRVERGLFRPEGLRGHLLLAGSGVGLLPVRPPPPELLPLIERFLPACYTE